MVCLFVCSELPPFARARACRVCQFENGPQKSFEEVAIALYIALGGRCCEDQAFGSIRVAV